MRVGFRSGRVGFFGSWNLEAGGDVLGYACWKDFGEGASRSSGAAGRTCCVEVG